MQPAFQHIYEIVKQIPQGRTASYGQIALLAGNPRWARVTGYAMRACGDNAVPCHRVVHKDGRLSPSFGVGGAAEQRARLLAEGVAFLPDGRVDMARCAWRGM
ncbi:MAG: MGMT family protein [Clostridia bacterium]|nr:MGMT family protein [Clostridia bacterium]